jgi:ArsR family transcriptional regulator
MKILETIQILKVLADRSRLLIIRALMDKPHYVEELSQRLDLAASTISFHLKKMEASGLVHTVKEQYYIVYHLKEDLFDLRLRDMLDFDHGDLDAQTERLDKYRQKVLRTFMKYGKISQLPVQEKKRRILYEEIVKSFEPGQVYTERDVNIIIADFHDDFPRIRRDMVEGGMMGRKRDGSEYWRIDAKVKQDDRGSEG